MLTSHHETAHNELPQFDPAKPFNQWARIVSAELRSEIGREVPIVDPRKGRWPYGEYKSLWTCGDYSRIYPDWPLAGLDPPDFPLGLAPETVELLSPAECQRLDAQYGLEIIK